MRIACALLIALMPVAGFSGDEVFGNWTLSTVEDADSYDTAIALHQDSSTPIKDESRTNDVIPRLSFQCVPGSPEITARIDWGRFISSFNTELGFKVDDGKRLWLKWGVDRSEKITISRSADDTQKLLAALADGGNLNVEISPYSEGPVTAQFGLGDLAAGLAGLQMSCN